MNRLPSVLRSATLTLLAVGIFSPASTPAELTPERIEAKRELLSELCGDRVSEDMIETLSQTKLVDAHTHTFNFRYLPMKGILYRFNLPTPAAGILASILVKATGTGDFDLEAAESSASPMSELLSRLSADDIAQLEKHEPEIRKAIRRNRRQATGGAPGPSLTQRIPPDEASAEPGEQALRRLLELVGQAVHPEEAEELEERVMQESFGDAIRGYLEMISVLTLREDRIARRLMEEYPVADTFVHSMMDMEHVYASDAKYSPERRLERVVALDASSEGMLRFVVAYDPFRGADGIEHVKNALDAGAVAVKFYPPSGYRASRNEIPKNVKYFTRRFPFLRLPITARHRQRDQWRSRYKGKRGSDLDAAVAKLFELTEERGVPVFSHHTPQGFEAMGKQGRQPGYGEMMAPPCYWQDILENDENFRLILAHSGGGEGWFGEKDWSGSFDQQAYNLCVRYPNVYCDFGMSLEILTEDGRRAFQRRLESLIRNPSRNAVPPPDTCATTEDAAPRFDVRDKIMYGSDWHMMTRVPDRQDLICSFAEVFSSEALRDAAARFFGENAAAAFRLE